MTTATILQMVLPCRQAARKNPSQSHPFTQFGEVIKGIPAVMILHMVSYLSLIRIRFNSGRGEANDHIYHPQSAAAPYLTQRGNQEGPYLHLVRRKRVFHAYPEPMGSQGMATGKRFKIVNFGLQLSIHRDLTSRQRFTPSTTVDSSRRCSPISISNSNNGFASAMPTAADQVAA